MTYPNLRFENATWRRGYEFVAGIDEVGRGAFAGPVVAGCVVFKPYIRYSKYNIPKIDDSKRLTPSMRNTADIWIRENALTWGIGESTASEIDRLGIVKATNRAMRKAIGNANQRLHERIQYLLIDAFYVPYVRGIRRPIKYKRKNLKTLRVKDLFGSETEKLKYKFINENFNEVYGCQTAIINGDQKSLSIAAASIIAKVYRDKLMTEFGKRKKYKKYGWERNKGYGTLLHRKMIERYGLVSLHRKLFIED